MNILSQTFKVEQKMRRIRVWIACGLPNILICPLHVYSYQYYYISQNNPLLKNKNRSITLLTIQGENKSESDKIHKDPHFIQPSIKVRFLYPWSQYFLFCFKCGPRAEPKMLPTTTKIRNQLKHGEVFFGKLTKEK